MSSPGPSIRPTGQPAFRRQSTALESFAPLTTCEQVYMAMAYFQAGTDPVADDSGRRQLRV